MIQKSVLFNLITKPLPIQLTVGHQAVGGQVEVEPEYVHGVLDPLTVLLVAGQVDAQLSLQRLAKVVDEVLVPTVITGGKSDI